MNHDIHIRAYTPLDETALLQILKLNIPTYFAETEINDLKVYLNTKVESYFVVELNNQIVGSGGINFLDNYQEARISWDVIDPEYQGRGIGKELLNYRLEILKSMESIKIISVRTSQLVYRFYEKNGFVVKEKIKDYWAEGFDMYTMVCK
ncbi:MAG TPA: GNAT family N-acetyltransferase [Flavobacterium sp.]|jgi:ribosomal protein S18 acetylase RimI-like enzyme